MIIDEELANKQKEIEENDKWLKDHPGAIQHGFESQKTPSITDEYIVHHKIREKLNIEFDILLSKKFPEKYTNFNSTETAAFISRLNSEIEQIRSRI